MSKGGLIIRLIDVALILLLGFIGISDFTVKTQIKLPHGPGESNSIFMQNQIVLIRMDHKGQFEIDDGKNKTLGLDINQVEQLLIQLQQQNPNIIAVIEPDMDSIIQITVDLIDICEKYHIPKSINYEL